MFLLHLLRSEISGFVFEFMAGSGRDQEMLSVDCGWGGWEHWALVTPHLPIYLSKYLSIYLSIYPETR